MEDGCVNKETIEQLEEYLSTIAVYLDSSKNCLEKINILSKINELVFWLQMYQDKYFDRNEGK